MRPCGDQRPGEHRVRQDIHERHPVLHREAVGCEPEHGCRDRMNAPAGCPLKASAERVSRIVPAISAVGRARRRPRPCCLLESARRSASTAASATLGSVNEPPQRVDVGVRRKPGVSADSSAPNSPLMIAAQQFFDGGSAGQGRPHAGPSRCRLAAGVGAGGEQQQRPERRATVTRPVLPAVGASIGYARSVGMAPKIAIRPRC